MPFAGALLVTVIISQLGCGLMFSVGLPSSIDKRFAAAEVGSSALKRTSRYWNDDLYPCIEKYCGQYVNSNTNMYVRCLSKFCQRGVLTVPARDLQEGGHSGVGMDNGLPGVLSPAAESSSSLSSSSSSSLGAEYDVEGELMKDQVFTLMAYCHRLLCPLDHDQDFSVFWSCAEDKCVPWFQSAWEEQQPQQQQQQHVQQQKRGKLHMPHLDELKAMVKSSEADDEDEEEEAHSSPRDGVSVSVSKLEKSSSRPLSVPTTTTKCTEDRIGAPGCDWKVLYRQKNAPLARKRRINDDVSQCIQSYCGGKNDINQRMFCVITHCHRIRSFN